MFLLDYGVDERVVNIHNLLQSFFHPEHQPQGKKGRKTNLIKKILPKLQFIHKYIVTEEEKKLKERLLRKVKKLFWRVRGYFPKKLPKGEEGFNRFCHFIYDTYDIPELPSYRHAIATMIMHIPPQTAKASPWFFARSIYKAQANEIAFQVIQEVNKQDREKEKVTSIK